MSDAEKIARALCPKPSLYDAGQCCGGNCTIYEDGLLNTALMHSLRVVGRMYTQNEISALERAAEARGYAAAREQAAKVAQEFRPTIDATRARHAEDVAEAIRKMEPNT